MLRTHSYTFVPGRKRVFKKDSIVTTEGTIAFAKQIVISAPCGGGVIRVREHGTDTGETGPGEFELPFTQGTYVLALPFRWPTSNFEVDVTPDDPEKPSPVTITLARSQEPDGLKATRLSIDNTNGQAISVGNVGASVSFPTTSVLIKCSSESTDPFCYSDQSNPAFATSPKLYPGEALPAFPVRRAFNLYVRADVAKTSIAEYIEVPSWD
jgi:hypothetical protein